METTRQQRQEPDLDVLAGQLIIDVRDHETPMMHLKAPLTTLSLWEDRLDRDDYQLLAIKLAHLAASAAADKPARRTE